MSTLGLLLPSSLRPRRYWLGVCHLVVSPSMRTPEGVSVSATRKRWHEVGAGGSGGQIT